jgi:hypothetical protein
LSSAGGVPWQAAVHIAADHQEIGCEISGLDVRRLADPAILAGQEADRQAPYAGVQDQKLGAQDLIDFTGTSAGPILISEAVYPRDHPDVYVISMSRTIGPT